MSSSLFDATVLTYRQILGAVSGYLEKGRVHCEANGIALADVVEARVFEDMLPFRFQVVSVAHLSAGAIDGLKAGWFEPPSRREDLNYSDLQALVAGALAKVEKLTPEEVNALAGKDVEFRVRDFTLNFAGDDFLLTFSLPNFYFHAATAYNILRSLGVPLGKRDFLGRLRLKT